VMNRQRAKLVRRIAMAMAASMASALSLLAMVPGCGPADLEVDKSALYTPESLAAEFAYRFKALGAETKASASTLKFSKKEADRLQRVAAAEKKGLRGGPSKKKNAGSPTLEDLLEDVDSKLNLIKGTSRSESCRKMAETIANDRALDDNDRKTVTNLVTKLAEAG
jgi:hypothetical protein